MIGDGLFVWQSREQPGVGFLSAHLSVTPDLIKEIAGQAQPVSESSDTEAEPEQQRLEHYVYVVEPSFGLGEDGSALSALDMGIARFISEMPKVARAIRAGVKSPTVDIYMVGGPTALGGQVTPEFVEKVKVNGFSEYGRLYAEFLRERLPEDLDSTRIVLQGASKGAITSDQTFAHLPTNIQQRTQLLYDNPAGTHGSGVIERTLRTYNMGVGMASEVAVRSLVGSVKNKVFAGQKEFYRQIAKLKGIVDDSPDQQRLKNELFLKGEVWSLAKGTPLNRDQRSFSRISTPDPVNINVGNVIDVVGEGIREKVVGLRNRLTGRKLEPRRALSVRGDNRNLAFATGNTVHNFPWVRSIDSGAWAQKMGYVENTKIPVSSP